MVDIKNKKIKLGFSDSSDNLAFVESLSNLNWLSTELAALADKLYIISFEKNGLLFMGINKLYQFTGNDKFISFTDFGAIEFKKQKWFKTRLILNGVKMTISNFESKGKSADYILYTMLVPAPWVKKDIQNIQNIASTYPSMFEKSQNTVQDTFDNTQVNNKSSSDATDELRNLKSLLDDGIITQEDFDAKKKQLLGL